CSARADRAAFPLRTDRHMDAQREHVEGPRTAPPRLALVVPCHNEQEVLRETAATLLARLDALRAEGLVADGSFLCFVDDGSTDGTWALIRELHAREPRISGMKLTRNFGHQGAVLAGMLECDADAVVTIDADL